MKTSPRSVLTIGIMSGTSLDGVDAALLRCRAEARARLLGFASVRLPRTLREEFIALQKSGADELHRTALAGRALARVYAQLVAKLLHQAGLGAERIAAIGAHGQTLRHCPRQGYSWQILDAALLAEISGIAVIHQFRQSDIAAGGQGAPLVPAFHRAFFGKAGEARALLNLGGIANLTLLHGDGNVGGFDCGPGNCLMDEWVQRHRRQAFDADGAWAATGRVHEGLLQSLLSEPYLRRAAPKSTGRDYFNSDWLARHLRRFPNLSARDVQASLASFTARSAVRALARALPEARRLLLCGGGAANGHLHQCLERDLAELLPHCRLQTTEAFGLHPQQVESAAFAWLAARTLQGLSGNIPAVTGAKGARVLGALWPAPPPVRPEPVVGLAD